jgi:hypothetical protein
MTRGKAQRLDCQQAVAFRLEHDCRALNQEAKPFTAQPLSHKRARGLRKGSLQLGKNHWLMARSGGLASIVLDLFVRSAGALQPRDPKRPLLIACANDRGVASRQSLKLPE